MRFCFTWIICAKLQKKTEVCKEAKRVLSHVVTPNAFLPNFQLKRGEKHWLISNLEKTATI